jgi:hypothetical protein
VSRSYLKDAARRRARRSGDSYQKALQALTRYDQPRPDEPRHPAGIDWSPLYGVEVAFTNDHHRLRGVVLPPDGVRPGDDLLRVAVTDPHAGPEPAEITYLDARWWNIDPMPDRVDDRFLPSTRRTRGDRGLPLYRSDNLPAAALATKTMLKRQRRMRPADDQEPVAEYLAMRDYYPLYAIDDAAPLPELAPEKQAAWQLIRTCGMCGKQQPTPFSLAGDGGRYCAACYPRAADAWWTSRLERAQELAVEWACELVDDPNAVIAGFGGWPFTRLVVVEIVTGTVLHDLTTVTVDDSVRDHLPTEDDDPRWKATTARSEVAAIMNSLADRRIISWGSGLKPVAERLMRSSHLPSPADAGLDPSAWTTAQGDSVWHWHAYWLNEPSAEPYNGLRWSPSWNTAVGLRSRPRDVDEHGGDGTGLLEQCLSDLAALRAMAAGPPTPAHRDQARRQPAHVASHVYSSTLAELTANADRAPAGEHRQ